MSCKFDKEGKFSEQIEDIQPITKKTITWDLISDSPDVDGEKREIKAIKRAFLKWGLVIPVRFRYVEDKGDISITFSSTDNYFKDRPNALAYAFVGTTSQAIDLVFNESYFWVLNREQGTNRYDIEVVAIHEIGHVLGLRHSEGELDVMYPSYRGFLDLSQNDITRMQQIHGIRSGWSQRIEKLKGYFQRII